MVKSWDSSRGMASRRRELQALVKSAGGSLPLSEFESYLRRRGFIDLLDHLEAMGLEASEGMVKVQRGKAGGGGHGADPGPVREAVLTRPPHIAEPSTAAEPELDAAGAYNSSPSADDEPEPSQLFRSLETITASPSVLLRLIVSISSRQLNKFKEIERALQLFRRLETICESPQGRRVAEWMVKNQAATITEMEAQLLIPKGTVSKTLHSLRVLGVVRESGFVQRPYRVQRQGPKVRVYAMADAPPEAILDAQKRYGEIALSKPLEDKGSETVIDSYTERVLRAVEAAGLTGERMGPVFDVVNGFSIPTDIQEEVKHRVRETLQGRLASSRLTEMRQVA